MYIFRISTTLSCIKHSIFFRMTLRYFRLCINLHKKWRDVFLWKKRTAEICFFIFCQKEKNIFILNPVFHQIICLYHGKSIHLLIIFKDCIIAVKQILQVRKQVNPFRYLIINFKLFGCILLYKNINKLKIHPHINYMCGRTAAYLHI